jgi:NRAMP (natural resistance-associated macrophage protein)-like metal ion transporter
VTTRVRVRRVHLFALLAVVGPGLIAGLSDDDPAGITTYSVLGANHGYRLLWVLLISTIALVLFHDLGARMGIVTGQGLAGLIRQRYGVRQCPIAIIVLVVANMGTTCAEFAGIAAGFEIFGVTRYLSVPLTAVLVTTLIRRRGFRVIERVLLALGSVFLAYIAAGILAHPDWGAALRGLTVPSMPLNRDAIAIATATLGTTLAPWGLAFIQSYAVDKRLTTKDLRYVRIDVITGAILTGVIGFFVVVACAATLHVKHIKINDAADAAVALRPLAGDLAAKLFALGLIGAALLAASILPLSTAYSVSEVAGRPAALNDTPREAPLFYGTFLGVTIIAASLILIPNAPLIPILVLSQILNAVLLLPLLAYMYGIARDPNLMGNFTATRFGAARYLVTIALITVSITALGVLSLK